MSSLCVGLALHSFEASVVGSRLVCMCTLENRWKAQTLQVRKQKKIKNGANTRENPELYLCNI